jgi:hypothetical protein
VEFWEDTNVSEGHTASVFIIEMSVLGTIRKIVNEMQTPDKNLMSQVLPVKLNIAEKLGYNTCTKLEQTEYQRTHLHINHWDEDILNALREDERQSRTFWNRQLNLIVRSL